MHQSEGHTTGRRGRDDISQTRHRVIIQVRRRCGKGWGPGSFPGAARGQTNCWHRSLASVVLRYPIGTLFGSSSGSTQIATEILNCILWRAQLQESDARQPAEPLGRPPFATDACQVECVNGSGHFGPAYVWQQKAREDLCGKSGYLLCANCCKLNLCTLVVARHASAHASSAPIPSFPVAERKRRTASSCCFFLCVRQPQERIIKHKEDSVSHKHE